jgi:hypothetical protein
VPPAPDAPNVPGAADAPGAADDLPAGASAPTSQPTPDQPTAAYPPADAQPTEVYPPAGSPYAAPGAAPAYGQGAYGQPPAAPPAYGQPPHGQPGYSQPGYGQPAYGDPAFAAAPGGPAGPAAPDTRPRKLGWIALGLAIGGLVLVGVAFLPLLWVSLVLALVGGLLLLVALVLGIVTLASKKQGGKGLGIGAIAISVVGGLAWIGAITLAFLLIGLSVAGSSSGLVEPSPSVSEQAPDDSAVDEGTDDESDAPSGTYDEAAYLAEVRPQITAIMQELDASITEEMLGEIYSDEMLVTTGQAFLVTGDSAREAFITSTVESSGGVFNEDQATRFFDAILGAAEQHLVE